MYCCIYLEWYWSTARAWQEGFAPVLEALVGHEGVLRVGACCVGEPGAELAAGAERQEHVQEVPRLGTGHTKLSHRDRRVRTTMCPMSDTNSIYHIY